PAALAAIVPQPVVREPTLLILHLPRPPERARGLLHLADHLAVGVDLPAPGDAAVLRDELGRGADLVGQHAPHLALRQLGQRVERLGLEDPRGLALVAVELGQRGVAVPGPADLLQRPLRTLRFKDLLREPTRQDVVGEAYLAAVRKLDRAQHPRAVPTVARGVA